MNGALGAFAQGLAGSLQGGIQLGQHQQALNMEQQKMEAEMRAQQAAQQQAIMQQKLEQFSKLTAFYKEVPESLKKDNWPTIAQKTNALFGTTFDPNNYPDEAGPIFGDANTVLDKYKAGKIGFGDTVTILTQLQSKLANAGEKEGANQIHSMIGGLTGAQEQRVRAQENVTREPFATQTVPEFYTRNLYKMSGLNDQQITDGLKAGTLPKQMNFGTANLIIQGQPKGKGKFSLSDFRSQAQSNTQAKQSLFGDIFGSGGNQ